MATAPGRVKTALCDALNMGKGLTAVIGAGGKTTLIDRLCGELCARGSVIVTTTTHIWPPELLVLRSATRADIKAALGMHAAVCVAEDAEGGKLQSPVLAMEELRALADYVLVEADGAKGYPLKAHAINEPQIPACADAVIQLAGADGLYRPITDAAHRPELYARALGVDAGHIITPEDAKALLLPCDITVVNKAAGNMDAASALARLLKRALITELKAERPVLAVWEDGECLYS